MKARIKATGEIFDIENVSLRLTGKVLSSFGLDEVEVLMPDLTPDYWTRQIEAVHQEMPGGSSSPS